MPPYFANNFTSFSSCVDSSLTECVPLKIKRLLCFTVQQSISFGGATQGAIMSLSVAHIFSLFRHQWNKFSCSGFFVTVSIIIIIVLIFFCRTIDPYLLNQSQTREYTFMQAEYICHCLWFDWRHYKVRFTRYSKDNCLTFGILSVLVF